MVQGDGFEPSKLTRQIYSLIPLAAREPLRMHEMHRTQQANDKWSWREELNPRPADYKSAALPTELRQPSIIATYCGGRILEKLSLVRNT